MYWSTKHTTYLSINNYESSQNRTCWRDRIINIKNIIKIINTIHSEFSTDSLVPTWQSRIHNEFIVVHAITVYFPRRVTLISFLHLISIFFKPIRRLYCHLTIIYRKNVGASSAKYRENYLTTIKNWVRLKVCKVESDRNRTISDGIFTQSMWWSSNKVRRGKTVHGFPLIDQMRFKAFK